MIIKRIGQETIILFPISPVLTQFVEYFLSEMPVIIPARLSANAETPHKKLKTKMGAGIRMKLPRIAIMITTEMSPRETRKNVMVWFPFPFG